MDASSLVKHGLNKNLPEEYRALLVGQYGSSTYPDRNDQEESLRELVLLSDTAGVIATHELFLAVPSPDPANFFSPGVTSQITELVKEKNLNLVVADVALKPGQLRNLEEILQVRVLGRIELILDIFAMRARSRESALQVELAQLMYIMPRLKGLGGVLSRLGGGIGTRGPGETMLETDRRHIRRRIQKIREDLESISRHRETTRKNRNMPSFTLVGYTNAGKTSLLNRLSSAAQKLFAEDRLFATLDAFSRKVYLGERQYKPAYVLVTDTIGFIRNLPASLVAAFESTLSEIRYTDALVVVLDASSHQLEEEYRVVTEELQKLQLDERPRIVFLNKEDLVFPEERKKVEAMFPDAVWGNTIHKEGIEKLRQKMREVEEKLFLAAGGDSAAAKILTPDEISQSAE